MAVKERQRKREESLNALVPLSVCVCVRVHAYVCVCCILISTLKRIGQREGGRGQRDRSVGSLEKVYSSLLWSQAGGKVLFVFWL